MLTPTSSIWAIDGRWLPQIEATARQCLANPPVAPTCREAARNPLLSRTQKGPTSAAVLGLYGVLTHRPSIYSELLGGTALERFQYDFQQALKDSSVSVILIDTDSPGGESYGVEETSDMVRAGRQVKPIVAIANSLAASAAYWIASAASKFYVTNGGDVGSIGVYAQHIDFSKQLDQDGVKISFVQAGRFKTEGNPYEPLSDAARAYWQEQVNITYRAFVRSVAANRGTSTGAVMATYGEGRVLMAEQALSARMVDGIATFDQVAQDIVAGKFNGLKAPVSAEVQRLREAQAERRRSEVEHNEWIRRTMPELYEQYKRKGLDN